MWQISFFQLNATKTNERLWLIGHPWLQSSLFFYIIERKRKRKDITTREYPPKVKLHKVDMVGRRKHFVFVNCIKMRGKGSWAFYFSKYEQYDTVHHRKSDTSCPHQKCWIRKFVGLITGTLQKVYLRSWSVRVPYVIATSHFNVLIIGLQVLFVYLRGAVSTHPCYSMCQTPFIVLCFVHVLIEG